MKLYDIRIRQSGFCQGRRKLPGRACTVACLAVAVLIGSSAFASDDYDYTPMARTGQDGLTGIKSAPSLNNHGQVAFVANLAAGESLFFSRETNAFNITPGFVGTTFSTFIQLIDDEWTVARDGSGTSVYIRLWDANHPDTNNFITKVGAGPASVCGGGRRGGEPCDSEFDCLNWDNVTFSGCVPSNPGFITVIFPAVNNSRQTVFQGVLPGFISPTNYLVSSGPWGTSSNTVGARSDNIRPVIADNGYIVGRAGNFGTSPLRLYFTTNGVPLTQIRDIASPSLGFAEIGQTPGISDDGGKVAFYANLTDSVIAQSMGTTTGPGIFAFYTANNRTVRVARLQTTNVLDLSPVIGFPLPDNRVAVNKDGKIAFLGTNTSTNKAIFIGFSKASTATECEVEEVVAVGDTLTNLTGTVTDLTLTDGINDSGDVAFLATMSDGTKAIVKASEKACKECSNNQCPGGACKLKKASLEVTIGLGPALGSGRYGTLRLYATAPSSSLSTPAALRLPSVSGFAKVFAGGTLRQARGATSLVDITVVDQFRYDIRFYTAFTGPAADGSYNPSGSPYATITIENPDRGASFNRLSVTRNGVAQGTFEYSPTDGSYVLVTGFANGTRKETTQQTTNGVLRITTQLVKDGSDQLVSRGVSTYQTFSWGEELVETREGPEPSPRITDYYYYTNQVIDGSNYRQLRSIFYPDGRWEFYKEYNSTRGLTRSVSQFLSNPYTETSIWPDPNNRSSDVSYDGPVETRTEYLKGHPISRRWHVDLGLGELWDAVATDPTVASYNSPFNLITRTFLYSTSDTAGSKAGQTALVFNPDGTMSQFGYSNEVVDDPFSTNVPASKLEINRTFTWAGAANSNSTQVIDGTTSEEAADLAGNFLWRRQWDIASGALTGSEIVAIRDAFGRPTRINYLDGTYITRTYDCCGLSQETDREGITTTFNTDHTVLLDLNNTGSAQTYYGSSVTRAGVATHTLTDALGRVFKIILQGTNGALIVQDERHYNILGDLDWSKDALGRTTTYSQTNQGGFTVRTTTFPDSSQSIESSWPDGSAYETKGNAVQGLRYAYEVVQDNGAYVQTTTQTRLENDGSVSPEYTTTYTDFAGRAYKTETPWPDGGTNAVSLRSYNGLGQLAKSTDADGVATLYTYNGRGELETTALDLANSGVIDFGGSDRITRTTSSVENSPLRGTVVRMTVTELWETNGLNQSTVLQISETSADGTQSWTTQYGLTTTNITEIDRANQRRTVTTRNPDGTSTVTVFEQALQKSVTRLDKNGARITQITFAYDAFGRLQTQTDARNGPTTYAYYDDGQIHTVTTPDPDSAASGPGLDPQTTTYTYYRDLVNGIKTVTTLPDNGIVTQEYLPSGQLKKTWGARTYPAEYTYDRAGRMETLTTWQQFNFSAGTGISGSATTRWNYNARGLLANKRYADNKGPNYTYTASGKLKTRLWARGILTTYGYDSKTGDLLTLTYSDTTPFVTNTYARNGQLQSVTDASGLRTLGYHHGQTATEAYTAGLLAGFTLVRDYDNLDRQAALSVSSPTGSVYHVTYRYDAVSRLYAVTSGVDVATYAYHPDSDLVQTLTQAHSNAVRLTTTKLYDKLGRLQSITSVPSADSPISYAYQYNDANQRTRATLANGEYWTYGYDSLGQVTNGVKRFPNGAPIPGYSFGYDFDEIGNRLSASRETKTDAYTNNALNQIAGINYSPWLHVLGQVSNNATITVNGQTPVRSNGYFYAQVPATNLWSTVAVQARAVGQATNGTDALAEETGHLFQPTVPVSLQYDDDGNLLSDGRWALTWDAENRVTKKETLPTVLQAAQRRLEYTLDSWGRRVLVRSFDRSSGTWQAVSSRRYLANRLELLAEMDTPVNNVVQSYIWGLDVSGTRSHAGGVGGFLALQLSSGPQETTHFAAFDGTGNVIALLHSASGNGSATYEYDPFGGVIRASGQASALNAFRSSTKFTEAETSHVHYEFRDYFPELGRWPTRDPIKERGGLNLFAFVRNAAPNAIDVRGLALYAFDGTGNVPTDRTNVRLTWESGYTGNKYYLTGIGTSPSDSAIRRLYFKITGWELDQKVADMLESLESQIKVGDTKVDVIGFSRGAVSAIAFAEAIERLKDEGVDPYCKIKEIRFMGLYDPVPGPFLVHRPSIPGIVRAGAIAYSLDEKRANFAPSIYVEPGSTIETRGFRGGHSDVGGGYSDRGLANISLEWMIDRGGAGFRYPSTGQGARLMRHQELNDTAFGDRENVDPVSGIPFHPSVLRLVRGESANVPLYGGLQEDTADLSEFIFYIDEVVPGNDVYHVGDKKF